MRYASVCAGIEAASVAWEPLGWTPVWFSEIEPFPNAVLKYRFPEVPNLGDMTKINGEEYNGTVDLMVGGTPCQGFSSEGLQKGLQDSRSVLALSFCKLLKSMRPRWFVWENVPVHYRAMKDMISKNSLKPLLNSGMASLGGCWTVTMSDVPGFRGELRKDVNACLLSDIVQETQDVHPMFYLSQEDCQYALTKIHGGGKDVNPKIIPILENWKKKAKSALEMAKIRKMKWQKQ